MIIIIDVELLDDDLFIDDSLLTDDMDEDDRLTLEELSTYEPMLDYDEYGIYNADGQRIGSTCGCEDYPCCGH